MKRLVLASVMGLVLLMGIGYAQADDLRLSNGCLAQASSTELMAELARRSIGLPGPGGGYGGGRGVSALYACDWSKLKIQLYGRQGLVASEVFDVGSPFACSELEKKLTARFSEVDRPVRLAACDWSKLKQIQISSRGVTSMPEFDVGSPFACTEKANRILAESGL